jgi:hypothetical protein
MYGEFEGLLVAHILLSQKPDQKKRQVINLDEDVHVCGYFWWMMYKLLFMDHLPFISFSRTLAIFLLFFFWTFLSPILFFSSHTLLSISFISFCIAHILFLMVTLERECGHETTWSFILWVDGWSACYLLV